ncbi:exopolysaccharide biosynthesis polyprenyl glycosylphosphotransferase (plasmid) [Rhodobacteraceae bacterium SC52]|nr:exopolysaccharide biosynthesis polyprenyl glycosylphosphotransferase [Rhodobacteraceae bacterium SC52]QIE43449.1 exopolysaccharide biosynthesis polyprenyl glycosylphosphotransferase [Rhodobacteraceae bacterium SC52]
MTNTAQTFAAASTNLQVIAKDAMDRTIALVAILLLLPVLVIVAIAIRLESRGPVLFLQDRTGLNGKVFRIFKFRSMTVGAGLAQARRGDARITRVGAFLRKTSIDELPQLLNVLLGHMSLVGPRPHAVAHDEFYAPQITNYMARYAVKPGMTGWAQVNNARGETETLNKMARRASLDLDYIRDWSLALDLKILIVTPLALLTDKGAY